jgi:hypothetical protein
VRARPVGEKDSFLITPQDQVGVLFLPGSDLARAISEVCSGILNLMLRVRASWELHGGVPRRRA